jgi:hypothetical protein
MSRLSRNHSGLLAAWLALAIQLGLAASVWAGEGLHAVPGLLCRAGHDPAPAPEGPAQPQTCPVCPLCVALTGTMLLPEHPRALPEPSVVFAGPSPARRIEGPPPTVSLASQPRGPPGQGDGLT